MNLEGIGRIVLVPVDKDSPLEISFCVEEEFVIITAYNEEADSGVGLDVKQIKSLRDILDNFLLEVGNRKQKEEYAKSNHKRERG